MSAYRPTPIARSPQREESFSWVAKIIDIPQGHRHQDRAHQSRSGGPQSVARAHEASADLSDTFKAASMIGRRSKLDTKSSEA
jgi:hypothetical protein